jgi:hypothetical protein
LDPLFDLERFASGASVSARAAEPVSETWSDALECLRALAALAADARGRPSSEARRAAREHYDRLLAHARERAVTLRGALAAESPEHRRWFTQAVCLWTHFGRAVGGVRLNTLCPDAHALGSLRPDFEPDPAREARVRAALCSAFGWTPAELRAIESEIERLISNLAVKRAITHALERRLRARAGDVGMPAAVLELMQACYGPLPLRAGDVDLVVTQAAAYFCLPYERGELHVPDLARRSVTDRAAIAELVARIEAADTPQTDRFPAFGWFERGALDGALCAELVRELSAEPDLAGIREAVVRDTLATMLQILPTQRVRQYLVHDSWGHGWQESLCEFEWLFARAAHLCDPVGPDSGDFLGQRAVAPLRAAFAERGGRSVLDEAALLASVECDLRGRILTGMNAVLAEVLADIADHKLVLLGLREEPSASLLNDRPVRFDLIAADVQSLAELWSRSYRELIETPSVRAALVASLERAGCPRPGLEACVERAAELIRAQSASALGETLAERFLLALAGLAAALEDHLAHYVHGERPAEPWLTPEASIDLVCLLLAWFYEQDRPRHLWQLADLLRGGLRESLERFGSCLRAGG